MAQDLVNNDKSDLYKIRHSLAHVLAQAVCHLYPKTKLGIGPVIENGFYYDFIFEEAISEQDLEKLHEEMLKILEEPYSFVKSMVSKKDALEHLHEIDQPFKAELASELTDGNISFYKGSDFEDLCRGPHVENTGLITKDAFKLTSIAGAYWRGDSKRPMMQRIYGVAFETKQELTKYLELQEEAKRRDHRKLGKQLDLFTFSELVGSGLPLFTPKGTYLRTQLSGFSESLQLASGFERVWIPHITKTELYKTSGHWDKFGDELFLVKSQETDDEFVMKPMNCPHHTQIYASQPRSYKDLPIRYMETTTVYRDEKMGEMQGLSRVRSITQDDAHIFCMMSQIEEEFHGIMEMIKKMYGALGMNFKARLSFRDDVNPEKYLGNIEDWHRAQDIIEKVARDLDLDYVIAPGEAAFYGPKIDVMVIDALGRQWQCATEQLDFVQPKRFGLTYVDKDGSEKTPVMIHKALLGSIERFIAVYIEHTAGNFPLWLSYTQVMVVPVSNDKHMDYALKVGKELKDAGLRVEVDTNNETMGNKIRKAQEQKVPYMLVVGDKEENTSTVAVRTRSGANIGMMKLTEFSGKLLKEIEEKK